MPRRVAVAFKEITVARKKVLQKPFGVGLDKNAVWLSGTRQFSLWARSFSLSFAQWAMDQVSCWPTT